MDNAVSKWHWSPQWNSLFLNPRWGDQSTGRAGRVSSEFVGIRYLANGHFRRAGAPWTWDIKISWTWDFQLDGSSKPQATLTVFSSVVPAAQPRRLLCKAATAIGISSKEIVYQLTKASHGQYSNVKETEMLSLNLSEVVEDLTSNHVCSQILYDKGNKLHDLPFSVSYTYTCTARPSPAKTDYYTWIIIIIIIYYKFSCW